MDPHCFFLSSFPVGILNPRFTDFPALLAYYFTRWITQLTINSNLPLTAASLIILWLGGTSLKWTPIPNLHCLSLLTLLWDPTHQIISIIQQTIEYTLRYMYDKGLCFHSSSGSLATGSFLNSNTELTGAPWGQRYDYYLCILNS